jgi:hypothetical protein
MKLVALALPLLWNLVSISYSIKLFLSLACLSLAVLAVGCKEDCYFHCSQYKWAKVDPFSFHLQAIHDT